MADLQSGETWVDGQTVNASRLNNAVNGATIQPAAISGQASATPAGGDEVLLLKGGVLKRATVTALNVAASGVTSVGMTVPTGFIVSGTNPIVSTGTFALTYSAALSGNKVLATPASGAAGAITFRAMESKDIAIASVNIAAAAIDWSLSRSFYKTLAGGTTNFTFSNSADGMSIYVAVSTAGHACTFPATVQWQGGSKPVDSASGTDLWAFRYIGTTIYGWRINDPTGGFS